MTAPEFCLPGLDGREVCLSNLKGKWVVLYFYPKDNTGGCTKEAVDFSLKVEDFWFSGAIVIGISKDTLESHRRFSEKNNLRIILLSDVELSVIKAYGAWGKKKLYGKDVEGVVRSTFLIDPSGIIRKVWYGVKVEGHAVEVLNTLRTFQNQ